MKTTYNQDFITSSTVNLANTTTLSWSQKSLICNLKQLPFSTLSIQRVWQVNFKAFDRVQIFLGLIRNAAKHIYEPVLERAARVIMTTSIHLREDHPFVSLCVIHLCLFACTVNVFARSCHDDMILANGTARMSVPSEGHLGSLFKFVSVRLSGHLHYLLHLKHGLRKLIEITTSNYIDSCIWESYLDCLEIMWEVWLTQNGVQNYTLGLGIIDVKLLWILFSYVY